MTSEFREWDVNGFDTVVQYLLVPIALSLIFLLLAMAVGPASAKPKSHDLHFTLNQVQAGCTNGSGTFAPGSGPGGYGCTGTGGTVSCTAKGSCTFTPKPRGLKISGNTSIENLIRS